MKHAPSENELFMVTKYPYSSQEEFSVETINGLAIVNIITDTEELAAYKEELTTSTGTEELAEDAAVSHIQPGEANCKSHGKCV
jgi:hypothetical protein